MQEKITKRGEFYLIKKFLVKTNELQIDLYSEGCN